MWSLACLVATLASALLFFFGTEGYYGTFEPTLREALQPVGPEQFDNLFLCNSLNGQGSDDDVFTFLLAMLMIPSLVARLVLVRREPAGWEAFMFVLLSAPALLLHFGINTCANIPLTLIAGHNVALAILILGWCSTLVLLAAAGARWTWANW